MGDEDNWKGRYSVENGFLVVHVSEQNVGNAEYFLSNNWVWPNGIRYSDGIVYYNEPIRMVFPVENIWFEYDFVPKRQIGSIEWTFVSYMSKYEELLNTLNTSMERRAIQLSINHHRGRNTEFESIELINSREERRGSLIYIVNDYRSIMRGTIMGIIGHFVEVNVRGVINMRDNTTQILEANIR